MANLKIRLLGKFQIEAENRDIEGFKSKKVHELFCNLLIHREHPRVREALASLLWGDNSTDNSKKYFRQALWMLQSTLSDLMGGDPTALLLVEEEWVQINPRASYWLDIAAFEDAYQKVQGMPTYALSRDHIDNLCQAIDLYRGDLMEGWYQDWCLFERERFQGIYQKILYMLTDYYELHHEYENGLAYARCILSCDHACEHTHRLMMRLYYYSGDRTQALRQYKACEEALKTELDVRPSQKTIELYEQIRADTLPIPLPDRGHRPEKDGLSPALLTSTLMQMQQMQQTLLAMQSQLQNEIHTIENLLQTP